jgi:glycerol-3-phosphate dehydrogenase
MVGADRSLGDPLVEGLQYRRADAMYAVRHEMATTLDDVLSRRTRALLFDREASRRAAPAVAALIAPVLGWDDARIADEVSAFVEICEHETVASGLREDELYA